MDLLVFVSCTASTNMSDATGRYFTVQHGFSIAVSGILVVADPMVETVLVIISSIDIRCNRISSDDFCVIVVTGTTGEGLSLTVTERRQLLEAWMDNQHKFEHQIFHVGAPNLRDSQTLVGYQ